MERPNHLPEDMQRADDGQERVIRTTASLEAMRRTGWLYGDAVGQELAHRIRFVDAAIEQAYDKNPTLGVARIEVVLENAAQGLDVIRPILEHNNGFARYQCDNPALMQWLEQTGYPEGLLAATEGDASTWAEVLIATIERIRPDHGTVPQPQATYDAGVFTYTTASGGCQYGLDTNTNAVWFAKLDTSQGVSRYSHVRAREFLSQLHTVIAETQSQQL